MIHIQMFPHTLFGKITTLLIALVMAFLFWQLFPDTMPQKNKAYVLLSGNVALISTKTEHKGRYATPSYLYLKHNDDTFMHKTIVVPCHGIPENYCLPFQKTEFNDVIVKLLLTEEKQNSINGIITEIKDKHSNKILFFNEKIDFSIKKVETNYWYVYISFFLASVYSLILAVNLFFSIKES